MAGHIRLVSYFLPVKDTSSFYIILEDISVDPF